MKERDEDEKDEKDYENDRGKDYNDNQQAHLGRSKRLCNRLIDCAMNSHIRPFPS